MGDYCFTILPRTPFLGPEIGTVWTCASGWLKKTQIYFNSEYHRYWGSITISRTVLIEQSAKESALIEQREFQRG